LREREREKDVATIKNMLTHHSYLRTEKKGRKLKSIRRERVKDIERERKKVGGREGKQNLNNIRFSWFKCCQKNLV
jgi:hypothetical protein